MIPQAGIPTFSFIFLSLRAILSHTRSMLAYRLSSTSSARTLRSAQANHLCSASVIHAGVLCCSVCQQ